MRILKIAALVFGALMVVAGGVLAYVAATFDPNDYKPQLVELVRQHTQRTLKPEGDIRLAFWPGIGAELGKLSLSERNSEKPFVAVEGARFSLKLLPLLSKRLVVDEVTVRGARISLVRGRDGRMNFDDLLGDDAGAPRGPESRQPPAGGEAQQFAFDIDRVVIADSMLEFRDEAAGARYAVSKLNLQTGRIAGGAPTDVRLTLVAQGSQPKLDLAVDLKTRLAFGAGQGTLEGLALEVRGQVADVTGLVLKAGGTLRAKTDGSEFTADKLAVAATGMQGKEAFDVKLDVPAVAGSTQAFKAAAVALAADLKQGGREIKVRLASPLNGDLRTQRFSLPQWKADVSATGPDLPGKSISGNLAGAANLDIGKRHAQLNASGRIADSAIKARVGIADFSRPAFNFDVDIDRLDVDRLLPVQNTAAGGAAPAAKAPATAGAEQPFDLSALKTLRMDGSIHVGALTVNKLRMQNVRAGLRASGGRLDVNPLTADLYQGSLSGTASVNAAAPVPAFSLKQNLSGVNVAPLLKDLADNETLEGRGTVSVDVTTRGNTGGALKRALDGTAALRLADGALKGIDIGGAIRSAQARLGALKGEQTQQSDARQKTDFSELTATFRIAGGVARNNDLSMKSPLLRVGGEGEVNIGADTVNYLVKASIVGSGKGQGGRETGELRGVTVPVRISGPLAAPSYKLDFGAMITDSAKQKVGDAVKKQLQKHLPGGAAADGEKKGGSARDALKGLLGR
ncbi:MAG: AsmA family protein [Burkholderiales bacterium]|nr:AsmA family protein [Burkholderiales bacterium]